jgi:hypothetical protein
LSSTVWATFWAIFYHKLIWSHWTPSISFIVGSDDACIQMTGFIAASKIPY